MQRLKALLPAILCVFLLCGCFDDKEIDETAYIIAIGIDCAGESDYKYTFQFSAPLAMSGGGDEGGSKKEVSDDDPDAIADSGNPGVHNVIIKAADFYVAKNMLNNFLSKNIDMSHLKIIVFSPEVDRSGYVSHSQMFLHEREVRPHTCLAVAERSAEEFIRSVNPELEVNTAKYYELMSLRSNNVYAPVKMLRDFADSSGETGKDAVLPIARISKYKSSAEFSAGSAAAPDSDWIEADGAKISSSRSDMRGMAVFRKQEPVGEMDDDSALIYNILTHGIKKCTVSLKSAYSSRDTVSFRVLIPEAAHFKIEQSGGKYTIAVTAALNVEYMGGQLPSGYRSYDELFAQARSAFESKISDFLYATSRDFGADILDIGKSFRSGFSDWNSLCAVDWSSIYQAADFSVDVRLL